MSRAFFVRAYGGPEAMQLEDRTLEAPGPGQIAIRNTAIGLNFVDTYQRTGLYATPLPFVAGNEGAGVVTAIGPDVTMWKVGDRVAYGGRPLGASEEAIDELADLDDDLDDADESIQLSDTGTAIAPAAPPSLVGG